MNAETLAIVVLVIALAVETFVTGRTLFRHQKCLEWFAAHIHLDPNALPNDAPADLLDMIEERSKKDPR